MRAEHSLSIRMLLFVLSAYSLGGARNPTYTFQVCMHGRPVMEIFQPTSNVCQLKKVILMGVRLEPHAKCSPVLADLSRDTR